LRNRRLRSRLKIVAMQARSTSISKDAARVAPPRAFVLDALEDLRRDEILNEDKANDAEPTLLYGDLNSLQVRPLSLLELNPTTYGQ
jgi:hypothetical protein